MKMALAITVAFVIHGGHASGSNTLDIGLFMRLRGSSGKMMSSQMWQAIPTASLLAVKHFNERNASVVTDLGNTVMTNCPVKLNATMHDTGSTAAAALTQFTRSYKESGINFDAIVGAARSAVTMPLATLAGIESIPQISYWSTSPLLEDKSIYPYFLRTIPSDSTTSTATASLFNDLGYKYVGIVHTVDSYGQPYGDAFVTACVDLGLTVTQKTYAYGNEETIDAAMKGMADAGIHVIMVLVYSDDVEYMVTKGKELGLTGPGNLWIFADAIGNSDVTGLSSTLLTEVSGFGRMSAVGCSTATSAFGKFKQAWREESDIAHYNAYFDSANTTRAFRISSSFFSSLPEADVSCYAYDAVIAHGIAACNSYDKNSGSISGSNRLNQLKNKTTHSGPSGTISFDDNGNRRASTGNFQLTNYVYSSSDAAITATVVGKWDTSSGWSSVEFTYSDGSNIQPDSIVKPEHDQQFLEDELVTAGVCLFLITTIVAVGFAVWTFVHRRKKIVRASQPEFLYLLAFGCIMSSATTIPLGIDDGNEDHDQGMLDSACQSVAFLYCVGFAITFACLFAKILRVMSIFNTKKLVKKKVGVLDMLRKVGVMIVVEIAICAIWTIEDPLTFEREILSTDQYDHPTESVAKCSSDHPWAYMSLIIVIHLVSLLYACYLCYQSRNIPTEFQEGKWINMAMVSNLQILVLGVPVMIMVADNPGVSYFMRAGIIFLNDTGVLLLMFLPKIFAVHYGTDERAKNTNVTAVTSTNNSGGSDHSIHIPESVKEEDEKGDGEPAGKAMISPSAQIAPMN